MDDEAPTDLVLARREETQAWWAPIGHRLETLVAALPAYRDTRSGRRNASQVRLAVLSFGVLIVVLWQSPWAPAALLLCVVALVLPVPEDRRRHWVIRLRTARKVTRIVRTPARLETGDKSLVVTADGHVVRLLRKTLVASRDEQGRIELRSSAKNKDRVLVTPPSSEPVDEERWLETADLDRVERLAG